MYDIYEIKNQIQKNIHNNLMLSSSNNENILNKFKNKINISAQNNSIINISFSTKDFPEQLNFTIIQKRLKEILTAIIFDTNISHNILIALEESIANIIEHSYKKANGLIINFKLIIKNNEIKIEITDFGNYGKYFDISKSGIYNSPEELRETVKKTNRGMGVYLIKKIMDNIEYEIKGNNYNKIIMSKKVEIELFDNIKKNYNSSFKIFNEEIIINILENGKNYVIIKLSGYLNMDTVGKIFDIVDKIKDENNPEIYIFDINDIEYISSSGIELFLYIKNKGEKDEKEVCFVGMKENIINIFKMVGFIQYFKINQNIKDAKDFYNKQIF